MTVPETQRNIKNKRWAEADKVKENALILGKMK